MATNPFLWNAKGQKMSPKEVERQRALAAALQDKAVDTSPVGHWTQGAARLVNAFSGMRKDRQAGAAEAEGQSSAKAVIDALMGGGNLSMSSMGAPAQPGPVVDGGVGFAGQPASAPVGDIAERLRMGMIERGLPEHVADGFLMNFQDESGLNPGINEVNPTVPGSRGGFGLYQLTGPRRVAYEQFAAQRGVSPADPDAQLDFMMQELQGPEAGAAQSILSAPDAGTAAAAIARDFLRPASQHLQSRVAKYTGGQGLSASTMGGQPAGGMSPVMQALLQASTDPWVAQEYGPVLQALMGQESKRQDFAMEQAALAADPLRQLQIQQAQQELGAPIEVGGVLLDRNTRQPIFDSRVPDTPDAPSSVREYEFYTQQEKEAGRTPLSYNQWDLQGKKAGGISVGGNNDIGTIPAGMMVTRDQLGNVTGMMPIPGGPAAVDAADIARKKELARSNAMTATDVVTSAAARAREANGKRALGGPFGAVAANIPTTANAEVYRQVDVLKSNAKVENLNAMRAASPTGGALGSVTDSESAMLAAKSGALDPASPNFDRDLDDYERTLLRVVHGRDQGDALFEQTRGERTPNAGSGAVPAPADILAMTEQELMMLPVDQLDEAGLDAMEQRFQQLEAGQ